MRCTTRQFRSAGPSRAFANFAIQASVHVAVFDGTVVTGRLLNRDTFSVQLIDSNERLRSFSIPSLRAHGFVEKSSMPSYANKLNTQQIADLVAYLGTLKGIESK